MAREIPGQVSYTKLVTVEVLIDKTTATETEHATNLVIKNEELPLQFDNHCQMFELVNQGIERIAIGNLLKVSPVSCAFGASSSKSGIIVGPISNIILYPMVLLE